MRCRETKPAKVLKGSVGMLVDVILQHLPAHSPSYAFHLAFAPPASLFTTSKPPRTVDHIVCLQRVKYSIKKSNRSVVAPTATAGVSSALGSVIQAIAIIWNERQLSIRQRIAHFPFHGSLNHSSNRTKSLKTIVTPRQKSEHGARGTYAHASRCSQDTIGSLHECRLRAA